MKIAAITDDGKTISLHFGRAPSYMVVTVEDGTIVSHEMRDKLGHAQLGGEDHDAHEEGGGRHGYGPAADNRHGRMAESISDCEAVLCRGMGMGAYENMKTRNIRPVVTDIADIDEAVLAYANGRIVDHVEKLH
jgi:predicted Fe-Mo cluster-binding NifX family protein